MRRRLGLALAAGLVLGAAGGAPAQTRPPLRIERPRLPDAPEVLVVFQAGDYASNIPRVLAALAERGALATSTVTLGAGETVCDVFTRLLPGGCTRETVGLAEALNPRQARRARALSVGQPLVVPAVALEERPFRVKLDPKAKADQARLSRMEVHGDKAAAGSSGVEADGYVTYSLPGYALRLTAATDEEARGLRDALASLGLRDVLVTARLREPEALPLKAATTPSQFWRDCLAAPDRRPPADEEGDLRLLLGDASAEACTVRCAGDQCPDVVLVDTTVWPHPEVRDFVDADPEPCPTTPPAPAVAAEPACRVQPFDPLLHHGTHMAGIVASAADARGVAGVAPGTRVTSVCWPSDVVALGTFMNQRQAAGGQPPIYLFASRFPVGNQRPTRDSDRLDPSSNPLGDSVVRRRDLWIVAAGQNAAGYEEVSRRSVDSPANLGDQENVLVVTACQDCLGDARLVDDANRSAPGQPMVHVAAPGLAVPGPVNASEYGTSDGTSQAAALVAGVAAAMKACYPDSFQHAPRVKTRIQTTSRPFPAAAGEAPRDEGITAGAVDVEAALLDPREDWLRVNGGGWERAAARRWHGAFEITPLRAHPPAHLKMGDIYRLKRLAEGRWVAFSAYPDDEAVGRHVGEVVRFGPGRLVPVDTPPGGSPDGLLELCDGRTVSVAEVDDVLLASPLGLRRNPCE